MAERRPLVIVGNSIEELPAGDTLPGGGGGGGRVWQTVTGNTTMASGNGYNADGALNMSLPLTISTGDRFAVHALGSAVTVLRNGNTITYKGTDVADDVTLAPGETIWLVATAADVVEIV